MCSLFLQRNGSIVCHVTGNKRYSKDLPQGGLEIPCVLTFKGESKRTSKAKQLMEKAFATGDPQPVKRRKLDESSTSSMFLSDWVQVGNIVLSTSDKQNILNGDMLNDLFIECAQQLLKKQFPTVTGLQSTLYQSKTRDIPTQNQCVQIIHSGGNHWIVASNSLSVGGVVKVYDSVYDHVDEETAIVINNLFGKECSIQVVKRQKQTGGRDCGLFAVCVSTVLCFGKDPSILKFDQARMRPHFVNCLEKGYLSLSPTISTY